MTKATNKVQYFISELKRRNVVRRNTVYAATAFVILELVSIVVEPLNLPDWTLRMVIILLSIGFVISIVVSWIYDLTPEGIEKTKPVEELAEDTTLVHSNKWKLASYGSFVVIIALFVLNLYSRSGSSTQRGNHEKSIAVLPFENMSDSNEYAHLGNAITDEMIMQLCKIENFQVRSRTSVMQYSNTLKSSPVIGQELNANYLLEGSVQRHGDQVRIRIQLIQAATDEHIWAEVFEGAWEDIFTMQITASEQVASELMTVLSPEDIQRISMEPTSNMEAYDLYLKGNQANWHYWDDNDLAHIYTSIDYYLKAIELDPGYSLAYTGLGRGYWMLGHYAVKTSPEYWVEAKRLLRKAIDLDPNNGWAFAELGVVQHNWDWDSTASRKSFEKSLTLSPNNSNSYVHYIHLAHRLRNCNKLESLIHEYSINQSVKLKPGATWNQMLLECRGEFDEMLQIGNQSWNERASIPKSFYYYLACIESGNITKALKIAESIIERSVDPSIKQMMMGHALALQGDKEGAYAVIDGLNDLSESRDVSSIYFANIYHALGDVKNTKLYLDSAIQKRDWRVLAFGQASSMNLIRYEPWLEEIVQKSWIPLSSPL